MVLNVKKKFYFRFFSQIAFSAKVNVEIELLNFEQIVNISKTKTQ